MDGVHPQLIIGASTEIIAGEGLIITEAVLIPIFILFVHNKLGLLFIVVLQP